MRVSRRAVLRGAGVALTLPWLESLQAPSARAQAGAIPLRFLPIFLPNGAPDSWKPLAAGSAAGWALSSVLEPLSALKSRTTVISGLENGSVFNVDGSPSVEPSHPRQAGAWLTCVDADAVREELGVDDANGVSVDQLLAAHYRFGGATLIPSLQVGLSTTDSYCDARPCSLSRSVSWRTATEPLYKISDPKKVFDQLVGLAPTPEQQASTEKRRAVYESVLDAIMESAAEVQPRLSAEDRLRMDGFLNSVREVEVRLDSNPAVQYRACDVPALPFFENFDDTSVYRENTADYDKGLHADLMNDLIVLAFQCDLTRVVSYMLEDERSEYVYSHVPLRTFTDTTSTPSTGVCGEYRGASHSTSDDFPTITWWNVGKVAELCQKLSAIDDGNGQNVLDNTVVFLGSGTHGINHLCADLPALLVGGGGGRLRTDQHIALENRPLRDLYLTLLNAVFDLPTSGTEFGVDRTGAPPSLIDQLLL